MLHFLILSGRKGVLEQVIAGSSGFLSCSHSVQLKTTQPKLRIAPCSSSTSKPLSYQLSSTMTLLFYDACHVKVDASFAGLSFSMFQTPSKILERFRTTRSEATSRQRISTTTEVDKNVNVDWSATTRKLVDVSSYQTHTVMILKWGFIILWPSFYKKTSP